MCVFRGNNCLSGCLTGRTPDFGSGNAGSKPARRSIWVKYLLYLVRWQLSTPVIAAVLILLAETNKWIATAIANLIGGLIFFWIDKIIFTGRRR